MQHYHLLIDYSIIESINMILSYSLLLFGQLYHRVSLKKAILCLANFFFFFFFYRPSILSSLHMYVFLY